MKRGKIILIVSIVVVIAIVVILVLTMGGPTALNCTGTTPNECNNQCWESCTAHHIFRCESSGGQCAADPNDCPPETPHSCNGTCWSCNMGQTFICNVTTGGMCKA